MELIILPLLFGVISFFVGQKWIKQSSIVFALTSLLAVAIRFYNFDPSFHTELFKLSDRYPFGMTFEFGFDGINLLMLGLSNLVVFLVALSNYNRQEGQSSQFNGLMFLMQFGLNGLFLAQDAILFYVFWEFTLIPIFLILYWFGASDNQKNLLKFFLYTLFGSLTMLLSIAALTAYSSNFGLDSLQYTIIPSKYACWIMSGFLFAFAVKIPIFPFHSWQPPTYSSAPMAGTMLLSAIMLKMALFGMIKWMIPIAYSGLQSWQFIVVLLGCIGILYGALIASREYDIKRVFAFASISHLGLIAAGIILFSAQSIQGALIQMVNHSLIAIGLFLSADILEKRLGTRDLREMGGIAKVAPRFGFWFGVTTFIALSVPMTAGFIGEFLLIKTVFEYQWIFGIIAASTLVFGAVYMIRSYQMSVMGAPKVTVFEDLTWNEVLVFVIIALTSLTLGLFPNLVFDFVKPSIQHIMHVVEGSNTPMK